VETASTSIAAPNAANAATDRHPETSFAPVEAFARERGGRSTRSWTFARIALRLRGDSQLLLAVAIAIPVLAVESSSQVVMPWLAVAIPLGFVGVQVALTTWRRAPEWLGTARLALSLAFVVAANAWLDPTATWPLAALAIPVVALAASSGGAGPLAVVVAGMGVLLFPLTLSGAGPAARPEILALAMAAAAVALGSRRVVANLERSTIRLRQANQRGRRHARQLATVESVGRLLAREGPTPAALDSIMGVLEGTFGYRYPSVYVWDGHALQLGAQRNYRFPIQTVTPDRGVLGRMVRTGEPAFLPDARSDPDFLSADPDVVSEIGIPLKGDGELLGILNVETSGDHKLDEGDFATMQIVGDRLAAALALGRERQKLTERAALLDRFTTFATELHSSIDAPSMVDDVTAGAARVIPADIVVLVMQEEGAGRYLIAGVIGSPADVVGSVIRPGEGISGQAISLGEVVVSERLERDRYPRAVSDVELPDALAAMSAPMRVGDDISGAVTWLRSDLRATFTAQEREVADLLAGRVGLSFANARLHERMRNAAITDPLTGMHNRRHFDAALDREDAVRRRVPAQQRRMRSAILFDLDHFGRVNKRYGHRVGDRVLRLFADTLRSRARAGDIVARYGGEEFVVILENASREDAAAIADQVRIAFSAQSVDTGAGEALTTTVSAGCSTLEAWEVEGSLLLERADVALAMAKAGGRDQVVAA
jgi:diguanylate cyclase (GGDEF)-like protein